jgi:hypothetical protein
MEAKGISAGRVSRYAVALVALGGALWVVAAILTDVPHVVRCFSCEALFGTSGMRGVVGYPPQAARDLAWADIFASLFIATGGLLTIAIALKAFRSGETWAWYAILVFAAAGVLNSVLDYLEWGGWFTIFVYGLLPTLGLLLSIRAFFPGRPKTANLSP